MRPFYYVRTQEKVEIALMDLFNDLKVNKYNDLSRTEYSKVINVPLLVHSDKNFSNWYRNADHKKRPLPLPIAGLRYEGKVENPTNRTQSTYCRNIFSRATDKWLQDIQPTPYKLTYTLEVLMDNKSDFGQITENIVPYFNPFRTLRIKEFDFAPDIERKILVNMDAVTDKFDDEINATDLGAAKHKFITTTFKLTLDVDWYRPFELPEIIKYAELNIHVGDFVHKHQVLVYPDEIAEQEKKAWETLTPSQKTGYSLLKTTAGTLVKKLNVDTGGYEYENITAPDAIRPVGVPDFKQLLLDFDDDTAIATDESGFGRDFTAITDSTREFIPDLPPGSGQSTEDGYTIDSSVEWNQILNWFGTNEGENENPLTFAITLQFNESPPPDTIFQYLVNDEAEDSDGNTIPEGEVYFEWGLIDSKLYFSFHTYGTNALSYTFTSIEELTLNNTDIYKFTFVLYENGHSGVFGYTTNDGSTVILDAERE